MKQILLFLCALIMLSPHVMGQGIGLGLLSDPALWKRYTVKDEKFSVALPNHPAMHTAKEKRQPPEKDRERRVLSSSARGVVYTIYVVENSKATQTLDAFIKEQTPSSHAWDLNSGRDLNIDGITGKAFVYPDGRGMVQFFAKDDRLYDFRAYGAPLSDERIAKFFSSVSLKKKGDSIEVFDGPGSFFETDEAEVYKGKDVDTRLRVQSKPNPTDISRVESEVKGTVILRCVFSSNGTVTNIQVIQGLPGGLTEKAIEAARQIKFVPATKDGHPVSMWMQLEYHFNPYR